VYTGKYKLVKSAFVVQMHTPHCCKLQTAKITPGSI